MHSGNKSIDILANKHAVGAGYRVVGYLVLC